MKKILSLVLALALVLSMAVVAHADDKVTINFYCNPIQERWRGSRRGGF